MAILRFFAGNPIKALRCVPAISERTITLLPSCKISSILIFRSGKAAVSSTRICFAPSGPAGWPGAGGMSTHFSLRILSRSAGSFLLNASYQRVTDLSRA